MEMFGYWLAFLFAVKSRIQLREGWSPFWLWRVLQAGGTGTTALFDRGGFYSCAGLVSGFLGLVPGRLAAKYAGAGRGQLRTIPGRLPARKAVLVVRRPIFQFDCRDIRRSSSHDLEEEVTEEEIRMMWTLVQKREPLTTMKKRDDT